MPDGSIINSARWEQPPYKLRYHVTQQAYVTSPHRFNVLPCGRRSGKTELFKRKVVTRALQAAMPWEPRFFAGAPIRAQAKRIFWQDLKDLSPRKFIADISEGELFIEYLNGARIYVLGLDAPERIEGSPWDGGGLDEFGNMRPRAWELNVRPALSDRLGWCDLFGVPEGRNHYYKVAMNALAEMQEKGAASEWGYFHWTSEEILAPSEIAAAKRDLDELSYAQEYLASFVNFSGRAYYPFSVSTHTAPLHHLYDPRRPLCLCFDFNVEPGVCAILQELPIFKTKDVAGNEVVTFGTAVIGEVWIPRNSNTQAVCRAIVKNKDGSPSMWAKHPGPVRLYGDATGGARGSAKVMGSDWDLIRMELTPIFGQRLDFRVPSENPPERVRINSVNSRLRTTDGRIHLLVDGLHASHVVDDFDGVVLLEGGSGELDKHNKKTPERTHITDAIGYYIVREFPLPGAGMVRLEVTGTPH